MGDTQRRFGCNQPRNLWHRFQCCACRSPSQNTSAALATRCLYVKWPADLSVSDAPFAIVQTGDLSLWPIGRALGEAKATLPCPSPCLQSPDNVVLGPCTSAVCDSRCGDLSRIRASGPPRPWPLATSPLRQQVTNRHPVNELLVDGGAVIHYVYGVSSVTTNRAASSHSTILSS